MKSSSDASDYNYKQVVEFGFFESYKVREPFAEEIVAKKELDHEEVSPFKVSCRARLAKMLEPSELFCRGCFHFYTKLFAKHQVGEFHDTNDKRKSQLVVLFPYAHTSQKHGNTGVS